jgi:hypothetical protein
MPGLGLGFGQRRGSGRCIGGGSISAKHDDAQSTSNASKARVSTIKVGGDFSSNSEQATSLEGSRISSGGNVNLKAGTLDYRAAQDTSSTTGTQANAAASLQVNVNAEHVVGGELSVAGGGGSNQLRSSSAVVGGISSGGNMSINVQKMPVLPAPPYPAKVISM